MSASLYMLKAVSLFVLVFQNTGLVLSMRWSRTQSGPMYEATTAVVLCEVLKLIVCLLALLHSERGMSGMLLVLRTEVFGSAREVARVSVPAFLYTLQSNVLYIALSNLDPAFFQVLYQLKILTTALFSITLLGRKITVGQWGSLLVLTSGVALVVLAQHRATQIESSAGGAKQVGPSGSQGNVGLGCALVLALCLSSGFAGVYFEKVLKGSKTSLVVRNLQLGVVSLLLAILAMWRASGAEVRQHGFFHGYNVWVWATVSLQAFGGLVVAAVMRFGDNILKNFALGFSILLSHGLSMRIFGVRFSPTFGIGALLVIFATFGFNTYAPQPGSSSQKELRRRTSMLMPVSSNTTELIGLANSPTAKKKQ